MIGFAFFPIIPSGQPIDNVCIVSFGAFLKIHSIGLSRFFWIFYFPLKFCLTTKKSRKEIGKQERRRMWTGTWMEKEGGVEVQQLTGLRGSSWIDERLFLIERFNNESINEGLAKILVWSCQTEDYIIWHKKIEQQKTGGKKKVINSRQKHMFVKLNITETTTNNI